jgi:hypothetical protein
MAECGIPLVVSSFNSTQSKLTMQLSLAMSRSHDSQMAAKGDNEYATKQSSAGTVPKPSTWSRHLLRKMARVIRARELTSRGISTHSCYDLEKLDNRSLCFPVSYCCSTSTHCLRRTRSRLPFYSNAMQSPQNRVSSAMFAGPI